MKDLTLELAMKLTIVGVEVVARRVICNNKLESVW